LGANPSCRFQKKKNAKNAPLIPKNDVTEPKARLFQLPVKEQFQ